MYAYIYIVCVSVCVLHGNIREYTSIAQLNEFVIFVFVCMCLGIANEFCKEIGSDFGEAQVDGAEGEIKEEREREI